MTDKLFYVIGVAFMMAWLAGLVVLSFGSFLQLLVILFLVTIIMSLIKRRKPAHHRH